jgi:hypothetical protein
MERIHACLNYCILYREDTWANALYILQVDKKQFRLLRWQQSRSSRWEQKEEQGATNSVASVEPTDTTLGISKK